MKDSPDFSGLKLGVTPDFGALKVFATDVDGTLTDGGMYYTEAGEVMKRFNTRDAFGMNLLRKQGFELVIMTQEQSPIVKARAKKLSISHVYVGVMDKKSAMEAVLKQLGASWQQLAYIGDDLNDLAVLQMAGFSACPADAAPQVLDAVSYVASKEGGCGAVREVCSFILSRRA